MFTPNDPYIIQLQNEQRLKNALHNYALSSHPTVSQAALHRRVIARFGATLVHVGHRLQAVNNDKQPLPQLDMMRNA